MAGNYVRASVFLSRLEKLVADSLRQAGVSDTLATLRAQQCNHALRDEFAGASIYMASDLAHAQAKAARAYELRADGVSMKDVAARLGISPTHAHSLVKRERLRRAGAGR